MEYYGGPGVQHIAMNTSDIITAVSTFWSTLEYSLEYSGFAFETLQNEPLIRPFLGRSPT